MRKLDEKFHIEDESVIKTSNGEVVPLDEPLFFLRARDRLAVPLLKIYAILSEIDGCNDYHFALLTKDISKFIEFSEKHKDRMKQPSVTRGL